MKRQLLILAAALFSAVLLPAVSGGELRLSGEPALWKFTNGSEFPGAKGKYESRDGLLSLSGDFTGGGRYVGVVSRGRLPPFRELAFRVRGEAGRITLRCLDAEGQTHQYELPAAAAGGE